MHIFTPTILITLALVASALARPTEPAMYRNMIPTAELVHPAVRQLETRPTVRRQMYNLFTHSHEHTVNEPIPYPAVVPRDAPFSNSLRRPSLRRNRAVTRENRHERRDVREQVGGEDKRIALRSRATMHDINYPSHQQGPPANSPAPPTPTPTLTPMPSPTRNAAAPVRPVTHPNTSITLIPSPTAVAKTKVKKGKAGGKKGRRPKKV